MNYRNIPYILAAAAFLATGLIAGAQVQQNLSLIHI